MDSTSANRQSTDDGNMIPAAVPPKSRGSIVGWVVAFLLFPYGPFIYLAWLRAIQIWLAVALVLVSAALNFGIVSVLAETNGEPWQPWPELLLMVIGYVLGMLQFTLGERQKLWGPRALRYWRQAAWFFGVLLFVGVVSQIVLFHLRHTGLLR